MSSKRERCRSWKLYVIADAAAAAGRPLEDVVRAAVRGGADVIQYRDKAGRDLDMTETAKRLLAITRPAGVPLIVNDRVAVARAAAADGVHLGQDDGPIADARAALGEGAIVGRSTHSPEQASAADREGADYIGVGPVFGTPTKPDYVPVGLDLVRFAAGHVTVPFVAIGGIDASNAATVRRAGARTVAVVRAVSAAADPESATRNLLEVLS
ncbi:MAG TPA: thiamine phosphate synthase [Candidatus Eisenbacteria bacterium]|jgi:thiamine-phosphate pyrophosphorylase|nr:thiamine phosphate synthase [Candidatus Eisenbacteria bacterium]